MGCAPSKCCCGPNKPFLDLEIDCDNVTTITCCIVKKYQKKNKKEDSSTSSTSS